MRLIDADRLLSDRMMEMYYHLPNGDTAVPIIDIEHAPTIGGWISVKDRCPGNEQDVLAYLDDGEETRIAPCNYVNGVWFDCTMNCVVVLRHVTHWMPLPEPTEEVGGDE